MTKRELPPNVYRTKGVIYFAKRPPGGGSPTWIRMETQFPEGAPVPFALHQERERLLAQPMPVKPGQDVAAVIRNYRAHRKFARLAQRTRADYDAHLEFLAEKIGGIEPRPVRESGCAGTWLVTFGIEVQSRPAAEATSKGRTEATAIANAVLGALDEQEATVGGAMPNWHVSRLFFETMTVNRLPDGRTHEAVLAFTMMAEAI